MLPLLTAATARELCAALPAGTSLAVAKSATPVPAVPVGPNVLPEQLQEQCCYTATIAGQAWLVCITGVGPINAALAMGLALARFPAITAVLNVGLAGSFDLTRAPLGSTIAVTEEIWPEYGLADDTCVDAAGLGFPLFTGVPRETAEAQMWPCVPKSSPNGDVVDRLSLHADPTRVAAALGLSLVKGIAPVVQGSSLTVAGVTNSAARAKRLYHTYAALIENMEGFAVALACMRHCIPLVELRTISNVTGSRLAQDRDFAGAFRAMKLFFTSYFTHTQYYYAHT